jgi:hypothetical protein
MIKYSNVDGGATPNLDFLKQSLVDIDAKILSEKNKLTFNSSQRTDWIEEASRLKSLWAKAILPSKQSGLQTEWGKAEDKVTYYKSQISINQSTIKTLESDRLVIVDKIAKYQDAVAQSLSKGNTDAGSQQVAELLIKQEVAEMEAIARENAQKLKNQKYGYLKYGGIGLGVIVLTFVVIKVLKK